jgi:hypothetical protein
MKIGWEASPVYSLRTSRGGIAVSRFFVGNDVSKDYSSAQGLDREGKKLFYLEFSMDGEGFS